MTALTLRLEDELAHRLAERAKRHGMSLEDEARSLLAEGLGRDWSGFWEKADRIRLRLEGKDFADSTELIHQDRQR